MGERLGGQAHRGPTARPAIVLAVVLMALVAPLVVGVGPAQACTCAPPSVADAQEWGGTGFVGALIEREPSLDQPVGDTSWANTPHRFAVEQWLYGEPEGSPDELTIYSSLGGSSCGFEVAVGERVAVLAVAQEGGVLTGGLCSTLPAEVALAEVDPAIPETGVARLALLGDFDDHLVAYFSADGRFLGYEGQDRRDPTWNWQPGSFPCADGVHAVLGDGATFRTISLATGEDVVEPFVLDEDTGAEVVRCTEPGDLALVERPVDGGLRLIEPAAGTSQSIEVGFGGGHLAMTRHGLAIVESLDPGERLLLVDADGNRREIGRLDRSTSEPHRGYASMVVSPDGDELAVLEVAYGNDGADVVSRIRLIDAATGQTRTGREIQAEAWELSWLDPQHLGVSYAGSGRYANLEVLDAATVASIGTVANWPAWRPVLVDGTVWGMGDGTLYRAELDGQPEAMFTLPVRSFNPLLVLAEPVERVNPVDQDSPADPSEDQPDDPSEPAEAASPVDDGSGQRAAPVAPEGSGSTEPAPGSGEFGPWWPFGLMLASPVALALWFRVRGRRSTELHSEL